MIEIRHLTKKYGDFAAVTDLNLTIQPGLIYGLLGPNGAGKSTTMNMMTGCLSATEGQVRIDGYDIFEDAVQAKKRLGYLPEQPPLYLDMTPVEYLEFVARAKGIRSRAEMAKSIGKAIAVTGVGDVRDRLIRHLSKGYRQRVGIAQALLGSPEVIILDEPTVGLDPLQIIGIRDLIRELGKEHTVILSSHILSEVRAVCDRIIIISGGRIVANDTPDNLEAQLAGTSSLELTVRAAPERAEALLRTLDGVSRVTVKPDEEEGCALVSVETTPGVDLREAVFFAFADARLPILRMNPLHASLEDVFLELTAQPDERVVRKKRRARPDGSRAGKASNGWSPASVEPTVLPDVLPDGGADTSDDAPPHEASAPEASREKGSSDAESPENDKEARN